MVLQGMLESETVSRYVDLKQTQKMFISKSNTSVKSGDRIETTVLDYDYVKENVSEVSLWVDRFRSHYPSHSGFSTSNNHTCFLLVPGLEPPDFYDSMVALQSVLIHSWTESNRFFATGSLLLLSQLMQNSWMITRGTTTTVMLIGKLLSMQGFRDLSIDLKDPTMQTNGFYDVLFKGVVNDLALSDDLKSDFRS